MTSCICSHGCHGWVSRNFIGGIVSKMRCCSSDTLFKKRHSQLSNWWHAPTSSLSLVDKIRVCLLLADTVCYLFYSPTSPGQLLQYTAHAQLLHCSWDCQAQICPHISYRNLKVCWLIAIAGLLLDHALSWCPPSSVRGHWNIERVVTTES